MFCVRDNIENDDVSRKMKLGILSRRTCVFRNVLNVICLNRRV